jgi:hypothetical protein
VQPLGAILTPASPGLPGLLACGRPPEEEAALALVLGEGGGPLELGPSLGAAAELGEQIAAHRGQAVIARQRRLLGEAVGPRQAAAGPLTIPMATARLSSTMGDGAASASAAYSSAICAQAVAATVSARAWQALIAACSA